MFSKEEWDRLRKDCYSKASYVCEVCKGSGKEQGFNWPVECHEIWDFSIKGVQKLVRLIALCPMCHKCQHPGLAQIQGFYDKCVDHYARINKMPLKEAQYDFTKAFEEWRENNKTDWKLDISSLSK